MNNHPVYLACPYSHESETVRAMRVEAANKIAAILMEEMGFTVYSPITHSAGIVRHIGKETLANHSFWMKQCLPMVRVCSGIVLLPLEGWEKSKGVQMELNAADIVHIPRYKMLMVNKEGNGFRSTFTAHDVLAGKAADFVLAMVMEGESYDVLN